MTIITVRDGTYSSFLHKECFLSAFLHVTKARWISSEDSQRDLLPNCKPKPPCHEFHYCLLHATGTARGREHLLPGIITLSTKCL